MIEWLLLLYLVDVHVPVPGNPIGIYPTKALCEMAGENMMESGKTYYICRPKRIQG